MKKTKKNNKVEDIETVENSVIDLVTLNADLEGDEGSHKQDLSPAPTSLLQAI